MNPLPSPLAPRPFPRGFTLIEIMIASLISMILFFIVTDTLIQGFKIRTKAAAVTNLQKTASSILADMTNTTRWANSVTVDPVDNPNKLIIELQNGDIVIYNYNSLGQKLSKTVGNAKSVDLHPPNVGISNLELTLYPEPSGTSRVGVKLGLTYLPDPKITYNTAYTIVVRLGEIKF